MALSRRTRAAGEEFGLHPRSVRGLLAATYEMARLLADQSGLQAELRLSDGPSLQVVFRLVLDDPSALAPLHSRVSDAVGPLRTMVDEIQIAEKLAELSICLRALFPDGRCRSLPCLRGGARGRRRGAATSRRPQATSCTRNTRS